MADEHAPYLREIFGHFEEIESETVGALGEEKACCFTNIFNDWIDVRASIRDAYADDELSNSAVFAWFTGLAKEVHWLQLLLLCGNYPLVGRSMRFAWEMIYRAYFADTYDGADGPGPSVQKKLDWLENRKPRLNWENCLRPVLFQVFPLAEEETEVGEHYRELWQSLNKYVHPSQELFYRMLDDSALLVRDGFDEGWAREIMQVATEVFDLIWLAVMGRFPNCAPALEQKGLLKDYPITGLVLSSASPKSSAGSSPTATTSIGCSTRMS